MEYDKVTVSVPQLTKIIDQANYMINEGKRNEAERKLKEIANVQLEVTIIPIYGGVYYELQVDA